MDANDLFKLKENLKRHISECKNILSLLDNEDVSLEHKSSLKKIINLIQYKNTHEIMTSNEEKKFIELMNSIPSVAIQGYNKKREVIYWNQASEKIYGYPVSEALGEKIEALIIPDEMKETVVGHITDWYENGNAIPAGELILERKDRTPAHVFSSHVMLGEDTERAEMFCVDIDLSEIAQLRLEKEKFEKKANLDKLTNTYNRHYFESIIDQKLQEAKSYFKELSLIMLDIDFFKKINDKYGHDIGDKALVLLSKIIKSSIRKEDIFVRWGGEEFILLVESSLSQANTIANKLREDISISTAQAEETPHFTCSFGVVRVLNYNSFIEAYKDVDKKLYLAKSNGRNRVEF